MPSQTTTGVPFAETKEEGSVLVVALLILVFLTLIGISASTTTEIEIQVAGNDQAHRIAFYNSDSGIYFTPKLIRPCIDNGVQSGVTNPQSGVTTFSYLDTSPPDAFFRQVMGFDAYDGADDVGFNLGQHDVLTDVRRDRQINLAGGGAEFAEGASGVGSGTAGGVGIIYAIRSVGEGPISAQSVIFAEYRVVPGVAGGL